MTDYCFLCEDPCTDWGQPRYDFFDEIHWLERRIAKLNRIRIQRYSRILFVEA